MQLWVGRKKTVVRLDEDILPQIHMTCSLISKSGRRIFSTGSLFSRHLVQSSHHKFEEMMFEAGIAKFEPAISLIIMDFFTLRTSALLTHMILWLMEKN